MGYGVLTHGGRSLVQMPLPQGPQPGGKLLKDHVEKDAAEDNVPAVGGQQGAH